MCFDDEVLNISYSGLFRNKYNVLKISWITLILLNP